MKGHKLASRSIAFWTLDEAMIGRLVSFGDVVRINARSTLPTRGQPVDDFFVVLSGAVKLFDVARDDEEPLATLTRGQFSGDLSLVSDRAVRFVVKAVARVEVLRMTNERFRELLLAESDIGEAIIRAFIHRHIAQRENLHVLKDGRSDSMVARGIRLELGRADDADV